MKWSDLTTSSPDFLIGFITGALTVILFSLYMALRYWK